MKNDNIKPILMSPSKVLHRFGKDNISSILPDNSMIVSSHDFNMELPKGFQVLRFHDYTNNDTLPLHLLESIRMDGYSRIIILAETDIYRASELRSLLRLPGMNKFEASIYRDKTLMKSLVSSNGLRVAKYKIVRSSLELYEAVGSIGLPCVVKPPKGRGSANVNIISNELELFNFLNQFPFGDTGHDISMLVEEYIPYNLYRTDGIVINGEIQFFCAAQYVGSHVDYLQGGFLGSVIIDEQSDIFKILHENTHKVMKSLPSYSGAFHLEAFCDNTNFIFSEVGARVGGGSIVEEVFHAYGVNLIEASIRAQLYNKFDKQFSQKRIAGQIHISPKEGMLVNAPNSFNDNRVLLEEIANSGTVFKAMTYTNAEFARAVFEVNTLNEGISLIQSLNDYIKEKCIWEQ